MTTVYYALCFGLLLQAGVGVVSLRAGVVLGGAFTTACGLFALAFMPELGFRRRSRHERGIAAIGTLIRYVARGGHQVVVRFLLACTLVELVAMLVFATTGSTWIAIGGLLGMFFARDLARPLYDTWLNEQITDSSVRATVISLSGQSNAIGQTGGGPVLGAIGNVWGIRSALVGGAALLAPAAALYARALARRDATLPAVPAPE